MEITKILHSSFVILLTLFFGTSMLVVTPKPVNAQGKELSERGKAADTNKDGLIQESEARGPLAANFDDMDCDKNGGLDGAEISGFFSGSGCPKKIGKNSTEVKTKIKPAQGKNPARRGRPPQAVKLDDVISSLSSETYQIVGRVVALQSGVSSARISGTINLVSVAVGERVKKGSMVAKLAPGRLITERKRAVALLNRQNAVLRVQKTALKNAKREFSRMKSLLKSAAFSRARFEDLEGLVSEKTAQVLEKNAQVSEALASLERIDIDIRDATIRAPFEGIIIQKHVEVGTYVNTGAPIVTLINDRLLELYK